VIPIQSEGRIVAVLDLDSVDFDAFSAVDTDALKPLVQAIETSWNQWET
jgi:putative methionine-R-sulfoxide reductase with GAF domain